MEPSDGCCPSLAESRSSYGVISHRDLSVAKESKTHVTKEVAQHRVPLKLVPWNVKARHWNLE